MKQQLNYIKKDLVKLSQLPYICFYCGEPASDAEHVYPRSVFKERGFKVYSCRECNCLASDTIFETIEEKQYYIKTKLTNKYEALLDSAEWSDKEIQELSGSLKRKIKGFKKAQDIIKSRLAFNTSLETLLIAKVLQDAKFTVEDFNNAVRGSKSIKQLLTE